MKSTMRRNLDRLLNPRHIAFIGGADAAFSAKQCAQTFSGPVWGVNPSRETLGGVPCFPSVADLPEAPDAVFIATPRSATCDVIKELSKIGAGGAVCFTAGYAELGEDGQTLERQLVDAAGDMAFVGPNCYGVVNYTNGATLWPFGAGRHNCSQGIALIMQSGMLPANMTMNDRSVPITHIVSAGNQSVLAIEDYMEVLLDDERVRAIGIYAEGIHNVNAFSKAAYKALSLSKPITIIKAGRSKIAAELSVTHTGSLSGSDDAFQALFDRLGIIRCNSPSEMLETLKFLSVSGAPSGKRIAGFTCSGGDAAMLADACDQVDLFLPPPSNKSTQALDALLPEIATVTNPLDYTTPLWGNREVMPKVFSAMVQDGYDAACIIQDFPPAHIHADQTPYMNDALSFADACSQLKIPAAVCSDLPENIDAKIRSILIERGITPLQGLDNGVAALANACRYGSRKAMLLEDQRAVKLIEPLLNPTTSTAILLDEWQGKQALKNAGVNVPNSLKAGEESIEKSATTVGYPVVLKAISEKLPHKTEVGAVRLNIRNQKELIESVQTMKKDVHSHTADLEIDEFLVEAMQSDIIAELLVGITRDAQFGMVMVIASGGVMVELINDKATLLLPVSNAQIIEALKSLKTFPLLEGFRGRQKADLNQLANCIASIATFAISLSDTLLEMEINPLMLTPEGAVAADVMIRKTADLCQA